MKPLDPGLIPQDEHALGILDVGPKAQQTTLLQLPVGLMNTHQVHPDRLPRLPQVGHEIKEQCPCQQAPGRDFDWRSTPRLFRVPGNHVQAPKGTQHRRAQGGQNGGRHAVIAAKQQPRFLPRWCPTWWEIFLPELAIMTILFYFRGDSLGITENVNLKPYSPHDSTTMSSNCETKSPQPASL